MSGGARRWIWTGAWAVATFLLVLLFRAVDTSRVVRVLEHADVRWLLVAVASNMLILPFGAMQWRAFLPAGNLIPRWRMVRLFALTSVANNTTPSLIGHVTGVLLLAAEPTIGRGAALSVLALDQVAVGIVKITVLLVASAMLPLPVWMHRGLTVLVVAVAALFAAVLVATRWVRALESLRQPRRLPAGLAFAVCVKLAEALAIFTVQQAFGLALSWETVIVVLAATSLGSLVPISPANLGTYEAATFAAYRYLGLSPETALGVAVVQHCCQLLPAVGIGYVLLSAPRLAGQPGRARRRATTPAPAPSSPE